MTRVSCTTSTVFLHSSDDLDDGTLVGSRNRTELSEFSKDDLQLQIVSGEEVNQELPNLMEHVAHVP
jgi:hypothetical protein